MNLLGIGTVIESVGKIAGDLITTDEERLELELRERDLAAQQAAAAKVE